jgi:hypothetical protein
MRPKLIVAILLIALGIVAFAYQGISYTTREKAVDIGALQITTQRSHRMPLPPIVGAIALVGGLVLLVMETKGSRGSTAN